MAKAKKLEVHENQGHLFPQMRRDYNPFWMSSLFSDVYLKNDVPRVYKHLWENDEIENSESGFAKFYQGFVDLAIHHEKSKFETWNEAQTVKDWIVPIMDLLGWENNSVKGTNSYLDNETFNIDNQTYKPDLIYFDKPKFKEFTQKHKKDVTLKLNEIRNPDTGAKMVIEAKHWARLSSNRNDAKKDAKLTDSAVSLGPELQTLKYMEVLGLDFGILTDGKTWKLFHKDLSKSVDKRAFTFDLGKLKEIAQDLYSHGQEEIFRENAKYFYYFFSKASFYQVDDSKVVPIVREVFEHSKKYAHDIEEDLKKRFIITMGLTCNALKNSCKRQKEEIDLETIRNVAESHLFNILFVKSCEVRQILPIKSPNYLKVSLHEVIEYLDYMHFDPEKGMDTFFKYFQTGTAFGGKDFTYEGYQIFDRFINLYEIIHDGTNKTKDFGFEIEGFKESIFTKEEWKFATRHKITNGEMIKILFTLNFIESSVPGRNYQQIPYSYFTPRQLGSIYESFLEFKLEIASVDLIFKKSQWHEANLGSAFVKSLKLVDRFIVKRGELFFTPDNKERKITGSYYTPDYVVKFIVEETIGRLIEDKKSYEFLNLKICDPAMGSGHFLVGALDYLVREYRLRWCEENFSDIDETIEETSRKILDACLFGVDVNSRAVKLAKMSLWLMTAFAGKKLENLNDQFKVGNSVVDNPKIIFNAFIWKNEFKKVFSDGGFDCVLGNPPYIGEAGNKDLFEIYKQSTLGSKYYIGKMDLWYAFVIQSISILKENGLHSFIAPSNWTTAAGAQTLREVLLKTCSFLKYIDFMDFKVFESASIQTMIYIVQKSKLNKSFKYFKITEKNSSQEEVEKMLFSENCSSRYFQSFEVQNLFKDGTVGLSFSDDKVEKTLEQIQSAGNFYLDDDLVCAGVDVHQDFVTEKHLNILKDKKIKKGDGIFVISESEKKLMNLDSNEVQHLKPYYTSENLFKYKLRKPNKLWLIYANESFKNNVHKFKKLKMHFDKYEMVITSDFGPYCLHRARKQSFFEGEKILSLRKTYEPIFTFTNESSYVSQSYYVIKDNRVSILYLSAILNSNVVYFWLYNKGKKQGEQLQIDKDPLLKIPLIQTNDKNILANIMELVKIIMNGKDKEIDNAEIELNQIIYNLYNLSDENILEINNFINQRKKAKKQISNVA